MNARAPRPARAHALLAIALPLLLATGCGKDGDTIVNQIVDDHTPASGSIVALTTTGILFNVSPADPGRVLHAVPVVGLRSGETLLSLDYRPADRALYGWSGNGRLYRLDPATGAALQVGNNGVTLAGLIQEIDFNPTVDRARITSTSGGNIRLNPSDGSEIVDSDLTFATGDVHAGQTIPLGAIAYTNNTAGAATTVLYGIDSHYDVLVVLPSPNNGIASTIGSLVEPSNGATAMDIAPDGTAWAAIVDPQLVTGLCRINLATGAATRVGPLGTGATALGLAVVP